MHIIFYGSEGSGKTTQGKLLSEKLKIPHLVSGDLVRFYAKNDKGIMGEICREALHKGHYVADSEMFVLWKNRLKRSDVNDGWVIDGFPRNMDQVKFLEEKLEKYNKKEDIVFFLQVREKVSIQRLLKRGRRNPDGSLHDSPEKIRERLRRYKLEEKKVLEFYKKRGVLQVINGEQTIEKIHQNIMERIKKLTKA
jgi:adenylate kinase